MAPLIETDPSVCWDLSRFGFGPFPVPGQSVVDCPPHPGHSGYGGVFWAPNSQRTNVGGEPYGLGSYGSRTFRAPPMNVDGGYGGDPYGHSPYGSSEVTPPRPTSAISLNGFEIEVYFSEPMDGNDPLLTDAASYTLTAVVGAEAEVTSVRIEKLGSVDIYSGDFTRGVTSVILTHTGTTLGGTYKVKIDGPHDISGNPILNIEVSLFARGEPPAYVVDAVSGEEIVFTFAQDMLKDDDRSVGSGPGIQDADSYQFTSSPDYPITLTPTQIEHPYDGSDAKVYQKVVGMTSLLYQSNISPATALHYDGSILPNAATSFQGSEINASGGSSQVTSGYLWMSKLTRQTYGWRFADTSGKASIFPSTLRVDFQFNADTTLYDPPLSAFAAPRIGQLLIENGPAGSGVQVKITLQKSAGGGDQLHIQSGTYDLIVDADWSTGTNTISVIRNLQAGFYSILFNGMPITSTPESNFTQTSSDAPGVTWTFFDEPFQVTGFQIRDLRYSATQTVYSAAWNFLHDATATFTGSSALTRDHLLTQRGPLVKGWGDSTPATKNDVTVLVNGSSVGIQEVNPYIGKITFEVPIPLLPPGDSQSDVKVDYKWMATPIMEMTGLNTLGLTLNKWDYAHGHNDPPGHGDQIQDLPNFPKGSHSNGRFPMRVVLGPIHRPNPLLIGHRYLGFERAYSALLNSPTTLLLNQSPFRVAKPGFEQVPEGVKVSYDGTVTPISASPVWTLQGTDYGQVDVNEGTYTVVDLKDSSFDPDDPQAVVYSQEVDLTFPSTVNIYTRFQIEDAVSLFKTGNTNVLSPDGVFTGVGFGIHNNLDLYLVGALLVNGVEHIGMLLNARRIHQVDAWQIGPQTTGTIESSTSVKVSTSDIPMDFDVGGRFQILEGAQAGVYTVTAMTASCDGTTLITVSSEFPADPGLYGNKYPTILFETLWSENPSTYRLVVDPEQKTAVLTMSGQTTSTVLSLNGTVSDIPQPAETSLMLSTEGTGQIFWGSLSNRAKNRSRWSFCNYGVVPDQSLIAGHAVNVQTEMNVVPEDDPNDEWFPTQEFGYSEVDSTGDQLLLKATSESDRLDYTFGYSRIEPFFARDSIMDARCRFQADSGVLGVGDAQVVLNDGQREVQLATLLYFEQAGHDPYRRLVDMPVVSMAGLEIPTEQGWSLSSSSDGTAYVQEPDLQLTQQSGQSILYQASLDTSGLLSNEIGGQIFEGRFAVDSYTGRTSDAVTGILFSADVGTNAHVIVRLRGGTTPKVQLVDASDVVVQEYTFDWDDGEFHTYRVVGVQNGVVSVWLDDELQLPTLATSQFAGTTGQQMAMFGSTDIIDSTSELVSSVVRWRSFSYSVKPSDLAKRTLGVWKGGDREDIDSWEIPRTDSTTAPNSYQNGPVIEEMDWRSPLSVRILRNPTWGVTVYRPDMALPPYYIPETAGVPGSGFANQTNQPSAGWINVEYPDLPRVPSDFGFISFGALDARSVSQQRWDYVRYRISKALADDLQAPQGMVLNRYNVISSGELLNDTTLETVSVQTLDTRRVTLLPTNLFASDIYKIIDGETVYTYESWTFDPDSQTVTLGQDSSGNNLYFSGEHVPVTVVFIPGKPVTNTYLEDQPLLDGVTKLNEGTPPVPKSQTSKSEWQEVHGSALNDPDEALCDPDFILNDPNTVLTFKDDPNSLYQDLEFIEVDNEGDTGLIKSICEGTLPTGFSGYTKDEGDELVYKKETGSVGESAGSIGGDPLNGTGASKGLVSTDERVGRTVGSHVMDFRGTQFWEKVGKPTETTYHPVTGMPGNILLASGGGFLGPTVNSQGQITGSAPLGGTLGPGTAVLYPSPKGRTYWRTDWHMSFTAVARVVSGSVGGSVGVGSSVGGDVVDVPLEEDMTVAGADNIPPTRPYDWYQNPDGTPDPNDLGACYMVLLGAGDYSHIGPWGGMSALTPDPDRGYVEFIGALVDGMTLTVSEESSSTSVVFVARNVPLLPEEFSISPSPHVSLALAINNHPVASAYVKAESGLTLSGVQSVEIEALQPVDASNLITLLSSSPADIRITGVIPSHSGASLLTGGAKISQSSLLAGGSSTVENSFHDSELGMVCEGGTALPPGTRDARIIYASSP